MNYFDGLIIVEGRNDEEYLSSFLYANYLVLNGYAYKEEDIRFLEKASKIKSCILLTDGDAAGDLIRQKINNLIPNLINIKIVDLTENKNNKHGIFECPKNKIIEQLQPFLGKKYRKTENIKSCDLVKFNLTKEERNNICEHFSLGVCNNKKMIERLNFFGVSLKELENYYGNK